MSHLVRAFQRALVPLAAYYAVTLALPVANGAARSGTAFLKHALVVLVVPLVAVAIGGAVHAVCVRCLARRRAPLSASHTRASRAPQASFLLHPS